MTDNTSENSFAQEIANRITGHKCAKSRSGALLFFDENRFADEYAKIYGIEEDNLKEKFREAFKIVTGGQGEEISKINSVISSSLLSLIIFFPIFNNTKEEGIAITIEGEETEFNRCFFEVKNKVIHFPSCIDVVLVSKDSKKMLFLESKFTEYATDLDDTKTYGKGYKELYDEYGLCKSLTDFELGDKPKDKLVLKTKNGDKQYIEGIKQVISHLIGLVRGPQFRKSSYYPEDYHHEYAECFKNAKEIIFGTIIYEPSEGGPYRDEYNAYKSLYESSILHHANDLIEDIKKWDQDNGKHQEKRSFHSNGKTIKVLNKLLTYQSDIKDYHKIISKKIRTIYGL